MSTLIAVMRPHGRGGGGDDNEDGRRDVVLVNLHYVFITVVKVWPGPVNAHSKLLTHELGLLKHIPGIHRQHRHSETLNSVLRGIKLPVILQALYGARRNGRVERLERFVSIECGGTTLVGGVVVIVVVVLTLTRIIKSVVTGQAPVTLELRNCYTLGKTH